MAPHSSTLAWKIPWMEEPGRLQSMGLLRLGHDSVTSLSRIGEGNGNSLQCSCLENPRDSGACWAAVYGVAQSRTRLKRLSSSSSNEFEINEIRCPEGMNRIRETKQVLFQVQIQITILIEILSVIFAHAENHLAREIKKLTYI